MDDIGIITNKKEDLRKRLERVEQLSDMLGLQTNQAKTEISLWDQKAPGATEKLEWQRGRNPDPATGGQVPRPHPWRTPNGLPRPSSSSWMQFVPT